MLYDKRKFKEPRKDKSPLEIEYEKQKPDCTFKPKLFFHHSNLKKLEKPFTTIAEKI